MGVEVNNLMIVVLLLMGGNVIVGVLNIVGDDFDNNVYRMRELFENVAGSKGALYAMNCELNLSILRGLDIFEVFCEILDKWIDGVYGDEVDGEIKPVLTGLDVAVDRMFEDDWRALNAGLDEYVWGWDGGGWKSYE